MLDYTINKIFIMKNLIGMNRILVIIALLCTFGSSQALAFDDGKNLSLSSKKDPRNQWGINFAYTEKGFGFSSTYYAPISKTTDLYANLLVSGVSDDREFEEFDIFGNSFIKNKQNRVFMIPLSLGIRHAIFQDDLEGSLKPVVSLGVAPTLVLTNPYDRGYFEAFGYFQPSFAFGGYGGIGIEFAQGNDMAFSFNANYYYLPVIGREVNSLENTPIKDLGGLQFTIGVNFLH